MEEECVQMRFFANPPPPTPKVERGFQWVCVFFTHGVPPNNFFHLQETALEGVLTLYRVHSGECSFQ